MYILTLQCYPTLFIISESSQRNAIYSHRSRHRHSRLGDSLIPYSKLKQCIGLKKTSAVIYLDITGSYSQDVDISVTFGLQEIIKSGGRIYNIVKPSSSGASDFPNTFNHCNLHPCTYFAVWPDTPRWPRRRTD